MSPHEPILTLRQGTRCTRAAFVAHRELTAYAAIGGEPAST